MQVQGLAQILREEEHQLLDDLEEELARLDAEQHDVEALAPGSQSAPGRECDDTAGARQAPLSQASHAPWSPNVQVEEILEKIATLLLGDLIAATQELWAASLHTAAEDLAAGNGSKRLPTPALTPNLALSGHRPSEGGEALPSVRECFSRYSPQQLANVDLYSLRERPLDAALRKGNVNALAASDGTEGFAAAAQGAKDRNDSAVRAAPASSRRTSSAHEGGALRYQSVRVLLSMLLEAPQGGALARYLLAHQESPRASHASRDGSSAGIAGADSDQPSAKSRSEQRERVDPRGLRGETWLRDDAVWLAWLRAAELGPVHALLSERSASPPPLPPASRALRAFALAARRRFATEQRARSLSVDSAEQLDLARRACSMVAPSALACVNAFDLLCADEAASKGETRRLRRFGLQRAVLLVLLLASSIYMLLLRGR